MINQYDHNYKDFKIGALIIYGFDLVFLIRFIIH